MIGDNLSFGGSMDYKPLQSKVFDTNKVSGGTTSLGGAGYEAYLKPQTQGGIGTGKDFDFGTGQSSYSANNYQPTQSDTLGGSGSGTTSSIANGGQMSIGQNWDNMSTEGKGTAITGSIGLLSNLLGGNQQEQQAPRIQAPTPRQHVSPLDMKMYDSRAGQSQQKQGKTPALQNVI